MNGEYEKPVRAGVIGAGYMGRHHLRILGSLPSAELVGLSDIDSVGGRELALSLETRFFNSTRDLFEEVECVVIAVPTELHFEFASSALYAGKDVLVEKPISSTLVQARELCDIAKETGSIFQVGHVERFNPACLELQRLVTNPFLISCERLSPYLASWVKDTGVILDLMIHDIDLTLSLVGKEVVRINALSNCIKSEAEDHAIAQLMFSDGTMANLVSSRISQAKVRKISITQPDEFICADLLKQTIAVHHFISSDYFYDSRMGYRQETVTEVPYLSRYGEPLKLEVEEFIDCVRTRENPLVDGEAGFKALELALGIIDSAGLLKVNSSFIMNETGQITPSRIN